MTNEKWMDFALDAYNEANSKLKDKSQSEVLDILHSDYLELLICLLDWSQAVCVNYFFFHLKLQYPFLIIF